MNPVEILEAKLAELKRDRDKADTDYEYAKNVSWNAGTKLEKLNSSVKTIERAIEVLKNQ